MDEYTQTPLTWSHITSYLTKIDATVNSSIQKVKTQQTIWKHMILFIYLL